MFRYFLIFLFVGVLSSVADTQRPFIVVGGGPYIIEWEKYKAEPQDRWWGDFVRAARVRIQEIQSKNPGAAITWLVYKPAYDRRATRQDKSDLIGNITSVRDKYGINLVWFDKSQDLMDYLNAGKPRDQVKIADFEYFGHSNRACWMFDYSNQIDSGSKCWLHEKELGGIHRGIFSKDAFIKSWSCHTGESMAKFWKKVTGMKMIAAIGKTDYSNGHLRNWTPGLSEGARWTK